MKLIIITILGLTMSAQAANWKKQELDFTCQSKAQDGQIQTQVQLKQLNRAEIEEEVKIPFQLEIRQSRKGIQKFSEVKPEIHRGHIITSDVHVYFSSLDKKVEFVTFLDELEETTLKIAFKEGIRMLCFEHRW